MFTSTKEPILDVVPSVEKKRKEEWFRSALEAIK